MMFNKISKALFVCSLLAVNTNVNAQTFKKLPNSLEYSILKDAPGNKKILDGSYVSLHIRTKVADSAMFDSYKMNNDEPIEQQLTTAFLGGFMEGFKMLTAGDSAIMRMPIDSAFKGGQLPPFAKSGDKVTYIVKIFSVKSKEEFDADKKLSAEKQVGIDDKILQDYIKANKLKVKKTASGLYYVIDQAGNGKHATAADKVKVHYKGTLVDGTKFDSSYDRNQPIDFPLANVIKGWTEGIPLLEEGGKGKLLIPSGLAYGQNPPPGSPIKPNSVLIFEVELLEILKEESTPQDVAQPAQPAANQGAIDDQIIQDYIAKNKLTAKKTESGLYYVIDKTGNGKHATAADKVKVHYKGTLVDGTKFDSSYDRNQPIDFPLSQVIRGWTEGIPYLEEGGKGKLLIPSALAYGQNAPPGTPIKPNDVLIFDVELLEIIK